MRKAIDVIQNGERRVPVICDQALALITPCAQARVEYFEIVNPELLTPVEQIDGPVLIAAAMWLGPVRLIDNVLWKG